MGHLCPCANTMHLLGRMPSPGHQCDTGDYDRVNSCEAMCESGYAKNTKRNDDSIWRCGPRRLRAGTQCDGDFKVVKYNGGWSWESLPGVQRVNCKDCNEPATEWWSRKPRAETSPAQASGWGYQSYGPQPPGIEEYRTPEIQGERTCGTCKGTSC